MRRSIAAFTLALLSAAAPARATIIVDQQNTNGGISLIADQVTPAFGQSFTPTQAAISFITTSLSTDSAASYRVDLFSGANALGPQVASSQATALALGSLGVTSNVQFNFASLVTLTPGSIYTFRLQRVSGANASLYGIASNNLYSGGTYITSINGLADPSRDLMFSEGYDTALVPNAVPEPGTIAGAGVGLALAVGAAMKRRRKVAVA